MKIAVDAMGGDRAPAEIVAGAVAASQEHDLQVLLVGLPDAVKAELNKLPGPFTRIEMVEASEVVGMAESPTEALTKKERSSINVGVRLVKDGAAQAFVSAGNTGAIAAASIMLLGVTEGIDRPAIATAYYTQQDTLALFLDVGANADCRPQHLLQFGMLGSGYLERVFGVKRPRVALLNIGEEEGKGSRLVKEAYKLFKASNLNFIGNGGGRDVYRGAADVIVTDGFTGNVVIKLTESISRAIFMTLKEKIETSLLTKMGALLMEDALREVVHRFDYSRVGGAILLGVNGNIIMAHGSSDARAVKSAIDLGYRAAHEGWLDQARTFAAAARQA